MLAESQPTGLTVTMSSDPSSTRALGAILALLPYWSELAIAMRRVSIVSRRLPEVTMQRSVFRCAKADSAVLA